MYWGGYIIPTIGVWDRVDDIDFDSLPDQFVLKCTHDSGGLVICKDKSKLDIEAAKKKLRKCLRTDYYSTSKEWPYKNVKRRIIAEKYMEPSDGEMVDYKIMCFNGVPRMIFTCTDRELGELKVTFFDTHWNEMPFTRHYPKSSKTIKRPSQLTSMLELAEKLCNEIPFVRVDFYEIDNKIYFGEMTFFPGGGFEEFDPEEWDYTLGSWIKLPEKSVKA